MSINEELLKSVLTDIAKLTGTTTIATECEADFDPNECEAYDSADRWLQANDTEIKGKFFEDVADTYEVIRPGHFRPFMLAWVDRFGGI